MSITSIAATAPKPVQMDLGIRVDEAVTGNPTGIERASAGATTRFELDAPAGAEVRVRTPEGVGFNAWAWGNQGRTGVSFAKQGAEWVATPKEPLSQISLQTYAFQNQGDAIRLEDGALNVDDLTPSVSVDGVASDPAVKPKVMVVAPLGWETAAADGTRDALRSAEGIEDTVTADRAAALGPATTAVFTGRSPEGERTNGPLRVLREVGQRVGDAAATTAYLGMVFTGNAG